MKFYSFCKKCVSSLVLRLFRVRIINPENEPHGKNFLVCSNHLSNMDPVLISICLDNQIRYMAKAELFKIPVLSSLIKKFGAFPVYRNGSDVAAIKKTISILKGGDCVGIFPQGKRVKGMEPDSVEIKAGTGLCAMHAQCDILPVAIFTKEYKIKMFRPVYVIIGKPIPFETFSDTTLNYAGFDKLSKEIFSKICNLINENKEKFK